MEKDQNKNKNTEQEIIEQNNLENEEYEFMYDLKIPKERIAVVIGVKGETRKKIEQETNSKIVVDSKEGNVTIKGDDSLKLFTAREIIKAIARGFNPEIALELLNMDYILEIINIKDYAKTKNALIRKRGRVIGEKGKSRRLIEQYTDTYISVYGNTVSIIGEAESVLMAKRAIEMLLQGSTHSKVYNWLERKRKELKRRLFEERRLI